MLKLSSFKHAIFVSDLRDTTFEQEIANERRSVAKVLYSLYKKQDFTKEREIEFDFTSESKPRYHKVMAKHLIHIVGVVHDLISQIKNFLLSLRDLYVSLLARLSI